MSDLTQQALTALADAGLGNESAAEAFVLGYNVLKETRKPCKERTAES